MQSQAEAELQKRVVDVARTTRILEETVDEFEVKKIQDLKVKLHVLIISVLNYMCEVTLLAAY